MRLTGTLPLCKQRSKTDRSRAKRHFCLNTPVNKLEKLMLLQLLVESSRSNLLLLLQPVLIQITLMAHTYTQALISVVYKGEMDYTQRDHKE